MTIEKLFSIEETARAFGVSPRTVWRWVSDGTFKRVVRIGGKRPIVRIPAEEIERLGVKVNYDNPGD